MNMGCNTIKDLEEVFRRLQQNRLITKGTKCEFLKPELEFLGHVVSGDGIKIDPRKVDAIPKWNPPTNIPELQSFLGFVNYVRRFVPNMAGVTKPLTDLLHKDTHFQWGGREQSAFDTLKSILSSPPVLRLADPSRPFEIITDASDFAVGAVLLQDFGKGLQPIVYESRKMQPPERNYPVHDKEMLAIVHAFRVWRCYLTGADVTIRTDHKSLQYLRSQPTLNPRQIRWLDYLESNFSYIVTYKKGANNIADALTRPSMQNTAVLVTRTNPILTGLFTHGYTIDSAPITPQDNEPVSLPYDQSGITSGPLTMVTPVTAKLLLPDDWKIHDAFHVSLLRHYDAPQSPTVTRPHIAPSVRPVAEPTLEPWKILNHRVDLTASGRRIVVLLRWKDRTSDDDTYVAADSLEGHPVLQDYLTRWRVPDIHHLS
ncbi:unnamed protein product [Closterium sp. NIES-53]